MQSLKSVDSMCITVIEWIVDAKAVQRRPCEPSAGWTVGRCVRYAKKTRPIKLVGSSHIVIAADNSVDQE
jgi:hypothetical protein